ncbi:MAG TPA: hypothetical protein VD970_10705 [Acetobacteraceae bacterium]|nr:hypothetical protein [Acetobacteraceae bacterium]
MADGMRDPVAEAAARLEAAVDRLAAAAQAARQALEARRAAAQDEGSADGVAREEVRALADRLDATLARLRAILGEDEEE